jgi:DNA polymerase-3 subunit gamma/tau
MVKHLQTIALEENIDISLEAINLVAQLAQGGLRDAESLLDQLALFPEKVTPEQVLDLVGAVSEQDLLGLLQAIAADDPEVVIDFTRKILDRGREPLTILQNFAAFYRDLLIAKTAPSRQDLIACTQPTWTALVNFAQKWDKNIILRGQQQLKTAEVQIKNTTQPRLWLEITLLGLLPSANLPIPALTTSLSTANNQPTVNNQPTANNQQPTTNNQQPTTNNQQPTTNNQQPEEKVVVTEAGVPDLNHTWLAVVNNLLQPASQSLFKVHGQLLSVKDGAATVSMPPKLIQRYITKPKLIEVETAFEKILRQKVKVTFISNQTQPLPENQTPENQTQKLLSENSPGVQQPVTTNYQQPTSSPAIAPSHMEINTASISNLTSSVKENPSAVNPNQQPGISPSSPSKPSSSVFDTEQDLEVTQAAKKLVDFFNGKIITLTDENLELSDVIPTSENLEVYEYNDD